MLNLSKKLRLDQPTIESPNLADRFSRDDLRKLGAWVLNGFNLDLQSRVAWERRTEAAMNLAMQITKAKSFPWPSCSNVAFPLVTIAALQLHARAYPALLPGADVVKMRVIGQDPTGELSQRARRVSDHMSWQVLEQDEPWEEQHDQLLINLPIVGTAFKKSYRCHRLEHNVSELVLAKDLVLNYWAKSVEACPRKTHIIPLQRNDIYERAVRGTFRDVLDEPWFQQAPQPTISQQSAQRDNRQGTTPPAELDETTPFECLEQHVNVDLDDDGYAEPYIITVERSSADVLRIVTRFDRPEDITRLRNGRIVSIRATEYFTKYGFIPSPDGGIYDVGFGVLLGPMNESVDTLINQLIDAGTMATTAGGFLGRGAKIRGGVYTFAPLEWKRVDATGDDLRKSIVPLTVREPSAVLFQLLSLLINYANRIPGTTEMMVGENPGQNTPAETSRHMIEQGMKIYNDVFKRVWRCMRDEFRKLYRLNGVHLQPRLTYGDQGALALREDYLSDATAIRPAADPNMSSETMRLGQAQALKQSAMTSPGYDRDVVERRWLSALRIDGIDQVYPGTAGKQPGPSEKLQIEMLRSQLGAARMKMEQAQFAAKLLEEQRLNNAKILEMEGSVIKMMADAKGDVQDRQINALNTAIGVLKAHDETLRGRIELLLQGLEMDNEKKELSDEGASTPPGGNGALGGPVQGMAAAPGDQGLEGLLPGAPAGPDAAMGSGGLH